VPTFRRDELLSRCLHQLQRQNLDSRQYEIIVVDDGPSESTRRLVDSLQCSGGPPLRYIGAATAHGPAAARNLGWRASRGTVIAFTDDDCLPQSDWLLTGLRAIREADAVTGRTLVPLPERPTDYERDTSGLGQASFITANCFCRRSVLEEIGGFDERFTTAWREDSDLHFALLEHGKRIVRVKDAVVVHPVRPAPWGVSLRLQRRGVFDPLLYRKHPQLYRQYVPPLPRWYYVAAVTACITGLALELDRPLLNLAMAVLWLGLTARFTVQRLRRNSLASRHVAEMMLTSAAIPLLSLYWRLRGLFRHRVFYL
jgi:glycosyltransferase involved in cell wall biosynthesis